MTCLEKLHQCKSLHDLAKTMDNFPRKYGDFEFSSIDSEGIKICHGYMFNGAFDWDIENFPFKDLMLGEVGPEGKDGKEFWPYIINGDTGSYVCDQVVTSVPTLIAANAGWRSATYVVMAGKHNVRNEYVVLSNSTTSPLDGRYISVNMDSHIAIVRDVLDNIY